MKEQLQWLFDRFVAPPEEWFKDLPEDKPVKPLLEPLPCNSYAELLEAWQLAKLEFNDALDIAFSAMLGTIVTTKIRGDQVFLRVLGVAGTAKTTLCEALCVNREFTFPMSAQRGFHSGFSGGGKDNCLIPLMDGKTVILNEGDMLLKSPTCAQTCSEMRDIWSGKTRAFFRNGVSYEFNALKLNFIIAGTPTLRELNESAAGDRFLDVVIDVDPKEKRGMVRRVLENSLADFFYESNGCVETVDSPELVRAQRMTGGYVGYLRKEAGQLLAKLSRNAPPDFTPDCEQLGLLVAKMRTRPMAKGENKTEEELHFRLTKQLTKLGIGMAVALNKPTIDEEVMRRLAHVAEDTCYGHSYEICKAVSGGSMGATELSVRLRLSTEHVRKSLSTLLAIEALRAEELAGANGSRRRGVVYRPTVQQSLLMGKLAKMLGIA